MKLKNLLTLGAITFLFMLPVCVNAEPFRGYMTASLLPTAVDMNGDGVTANAVDAFGTFSGLGEVTAKGRSESLPWDLASFCSPTEIKLKFLIHNGVMTASNGDLLFYVLDANNPANEFCVNIVDGVSFRGTTNYLIVGGTGRFTGATGYFTLEGRGTRILNLAGTQVGGAAEGPMSGEIFPMHDGDD